MYIEMGFSVDCASRYRSCATTTDARSSCMGPLRQMMRSCSRREKMSNALSPRGVLSTTMGMSEAWRRDGAVRATAGAGGIITRRAMSEAERRPSIMRAHARGRSPGNS